jgi:hypothetical protein
MIRFIKRIRLRFKLGWWIMLRRELIINMHYGSEPCIYYPKIDSYKVAIRLCTMKINKLKKQLHDK